VGVVNGGAHALVRLLALQASWSYERMQGVGLGWAAQPILYRLFQNDEPRYRSALGRAAGFFNANPYLAAAAVGAETRAEADGVPGPQVERLRTALCGPLGSLGDRLFWTGLVPGLAAAAVIAVSLGAGLWVVGAFLVVHNLVRGALSGWMLGLGWQHGLRIGTAINQSGLPRASQVAVTAAAVLGGLAIPTAGAWFLDLGELGDVGVVMALMLGMLLLRRIAGPRASALTLTLLAVAVTVLWQVARS
jgi:PTS system mannose-specific IID component